MNEEIALESLIDFIPATNNKNPNPPSNSSSPSDQLVSSNKENPISVSECLRRHSGAVYVQGTITSMSRLYKMVKSVTMGCSNCSSNQKVDYQIPKSFPANTATNQKCGDCKDGMNWHEYEYVNAVSVELQDSYTFSDIEKLSCILFDEDTMDIQIGSQVVVSGSIQIINQKYKKSIPCLYASSVYYENREKLELSDQDVDSIVKLAKSKGDRTIERLTKMFAPSVIGLDVIKKGLLLSAVSSSEDKISNGIARDRIHLLLVGTPGIGKSKLIKEATKIVPNSRYESSQHSSGKSLTAIVSKENDDFCLRLGPIPLARGSVCVLNEIGRISPEDQGFLLDVMEEGEFTINKHGINAKIKSPTVIIASANPLGSTWSNQTKNDINDKIDMSKIPLVQPVIDRFDLKFVLKDSKDEKELRDYADLKTRLLAEKPPDYYQYLKKYIAYAKQINPTLTEESRLLLGEYYVNLSISLSTSNPNLGSKRVLETLIRVAKSISKLKLKVVVDTEDAKEALEFYSAMIHQYLDSTVLIPDDPKNIAIFELTNILKNSAFAYTLEELAKTGCEKNEYVKSYLLGGHKNNNYKHLLKIENNRKLRSTYELLIENPNIKRIQEKPIVLQWISSNPDSLSDISDATDTAKKEIDCNPDNSGAEIPSDRSDMSGTPPTKNHNGVETNFIKNENALNKEEIEEILKSEPRMGYREPFYYCKQHPKVQNINHEEIKNHLRYSKVHKSP